MANERDTSTLEGENDLKQFLKVVQPDWSMPRRNRTTDINRVVKKLMDIGVKDSFDLMGRVTTNRINEDLSNSGYPRFSRETLDRMRKHGTFFRALENLTEANYRQVGVFSPVAQLLSKTNLKKQADKQRSEKRLIGERIGMGLLADGSLFTEQPSRFSAMTATASSRESLGLGETLGSLTSFGDPFYSSISEATWVGGDMTLDAPPKLRGYRGVIRGTSLAGTPSKSRPSTTPAGGSSVPSLLPALGGSACFFATSGATSMAPRLNGNSTADLGLSRTRGLSHSLTLKSDPTVKSLTNSETTAIGSSPIGPPGKGAILIERARGGRAGTLSCSSMDFADRPGSPNLRVVPRAAWPVCLEAELQELAEVANLSKHTDGSGGLSFAVEEAFEKLCRLGEEELCLMDQDKSFEAQEGSELQVFRVAAHYAKLGLEPLRVARTLRSPSLTMAQVRRQLDVAAVHRVRKAGEAAAWSHTRPSCWAGFARSVTTPPTVSLSSGFAERGGGGFGGSQPGSPASTGSLAQPQAPPAAWKEKGWRSVDKYADHMLREQEELQAKRRLYRVMEAEGRASPTRKFVTENIRSRLMEERDPEAEKMETQQTCNNIRRQILSIGNAKREINNMRRAIEADEPVTRSQVYKDAADKSGITAALGFGGFGFGKLVKPMQSQDE